MSLNRSTVLAAGRNMTFAALLCLSAAAGAVDLKRQQAFDIPAQKLSTALLEFSHQAGVQVVVGPEVGERTAPRVKGTFTLEDVLSRLLASSELKYSVIGKTSISVGKPGAGATTSDASVTTALLRMAASGADDVAGPDKGARQGARAVESAPPAAAEGKPGEEVIVTGSRLRGVDPVAPVIIIDREDIERRGALTAEEIIRTLPQNFAATNTTSTTSSTTPNEYAGGFTDFDAAGISAANLRGLGEASTLVLINGRRTAGSPLARGQFVNLSTIPTSDIERIEIVTQGASALYGADAVGGVINIILREHRTTSATSSARYDTSAHGKDRMSFMQMGTYGWEGGSVTAALNYTHTEPLNPQAAGYLTNDFRSRGGSDRRGTGLFNASVSPFVGNSGLTAPAGFNGVIDTNNDGVNSPAEIAAARALFTAFDRNAPFRENLATEMSPEVRNYNLNLRAQQTIADGLKLYAFGTYNLSKNRFAGAPAPGITVSSSTTAPGLAVPANNPYNPFGTAQTLRYTFYQEMLDGLVPASVRETEQKRIDGTVGTTWDLPFRDWRFDFGITRSQEQTEGLDIGPLTRNSRLDSAGQVDGRSPMERLILGFHPVTGAPLTNRSDFINLFGNGTVQTPLLALTSGQTRNQQPSSTSWQYSATTEGWLANLPGGQVRSVLGVEYRTEGIDYANNEDRASSAAGVTGGFFRRLIELERESIEVFNQTALPIVGEGNRRPGIDSLMLNVAARWSDYTFKRPRVGQQDANPGVIDIDDLYSPASFGNVSPGFGVSYRPVSALNLRANWTENFRTPIFTDLVGGGLGAGYMPLTLADGTNIRATPVRIGNPDLKPEVSDNISAGFDWMPVRGLRVSATWQRIKTDNAIGSEPTFGLTAEDFIARGDLIQDPADPNGWRLVSRPINLDLRLREFTDLTVRYDFETALGSFSATLDGTYFHKNLVNITTAATGVVNSYRYDGTNFGPNRVQGRGELLWGNGPWVASAALNYGSAYTWYNGIASRSSFTPLVTRHVSHYTTLDITGSYEMRSGLRFVGGVTDLTNTDFPFVDEGLGFNSSKVNLQGRTLFMQVQKNFAL